MKKTLVIICAIMMIFILVACSDNNGGINDLEAISVYDSVSEQYISLGETKNSIDKKLGEPTLDGDEYKYDGGLDVKYIDDKAVFLDAYKTNQFSTKEFIPGETQEEAFIGSDNYSKSEYYGIKNFYYDINGNEVAEEDAYYKKTILFDNKKGFIELLIEQL